MQINGINPAASFTGRVDSKLADYIQRQSDNAISEEIAKGKLTGEVDDKKIDTYMQCQANLMKILTEKADKMGEHSYIGLDGGDAKNPNLTLVVGMEDENETYSKTTPKAKVKYGDPYDPYKETTEVKDNPHDWILEVKGIENMTGSVYKPEYQLQSLVRMARELDPESSAEKAFLKAFD